MFTVFVETANGHVEIMARTTNRRAAADVAATVHGANFTVHIMEGASR